MRLVLFVFLLLVAFPFRSPAPLIYTPGEGWTYEAVGSEGKWQRTRARDQLVVAQDAFDKGDYSLALRAARRTVKNWPLSDYAPQAQYLIGRCLEMKRFDERAFKEYQKLLENYPKAINYDEVLQRQYDIAERFLGGQWFRLWTYIPFFPSMEKTADLFEKIVKNGPYSEIAPRAQLKVGEAREKQKNYALAVKAYERAADRYNDRADIAADAIFRQGLAYHKQAQRAEYDQSTAGKAIAAFTDFITLFPDDPRAEQAREIISALKTEQARGNFEIAKFYERSQKLVAARTYYNEVVNLMLGEPNSPYAIDARERIASLNQQIQATGK